MVIAMLKCYHDFVEIQSFSILTPDNIVGKNEKPSFKIVAWNVLTNIHTYIHTNKHTNRLTNMVIYVKNKEINIKHIQI